MKKGDQTRERIIEQTAPLFNKLGYFGASLADVMQATGLKKGGIYNHFGSKDELALEAFEYAASCSSRRFAERIAGKTSAVDKLLAQAEVFAENFANPPIAGGCPVLNTAVESDDAHPQLRKRVVQAMDRWREKISKIVEEGKRTGELKPNLESDVVATQMIATLEGGTMMSRLYGEPTHINRAVQFISAYIQNDLKA
jgi:AcrR family transcriptional regulator